MNKKYCESCDIFFPKEDVHECANKSHTGSKRYNTGKPEMSQLDPQFLLALADLMTQSAKKYGKFNWALGQDYSTPYDSMMRHILAFMSGEDIDKESGHNHLLHVAANAMILWRSHQKGGELDDRFEGFKDDE